VPDRTKACRRSGEEVDGRNLIKGDVHILIRRGPRHVRFTLAELLIGELADADVIVHDDGFLAAGVPEHDDR
jgi:hypothetical protein